MDAGKEVGTRGEGDSVCGLAWLHDGRADRCLSSFSMVSCADALTGSGHVPGPVDPIVTFEFCLLLMVRECCDVPPASAG